MDRDPGPTTTCRPSRDVAAQHPAFRTSTGAPPPISLAPPPCGGPWNVSLPATSSIAWNPSPPGYRSLRSPIPAEIDRYPDRRADSYCRDSRPGHRGPAWSRTSETACWDSPPSASRSRYAMRPSTPSTPSRRRRYLLPDRQRTDQRGPEPQRIEPETRSFSPRRMARSAARRSPSGRPAPPVNRSLPRAGRALTVEEAVDDGTAIGDLDGHRVESARAALATCSMRPSATGRGPV